MDWALQALRNTKLLFGTLLFFGLLAMTARTATDPDLWWHLRTGEWIVQTGQVPHNDPFSFTRAGRPWVSHEWLSEVLFYGIWRFASWAGLIVFSSMITTGGFMLLYLRCRARPHWAAGATTLGALASAPAWGVRPQMFTFLLASVLLWLVERAEEKPWLLLWIPPVFLLWLNLHAGFALGPALLLAWCAGLAWEGVSGETDWTVVRPQIVRLLLVIAACIAVVPLNPSGAELYRYPLDVLRSGGMRSFIAEWASPDFHQGRYAAMHLLCLALLILFARGAVRPKVRVLFPLLGTLLAALDAVRHIPIFVLFAVPVIAAALPVGSIRAPDNKAAQHTKFRGRFAACVVILIAVFCLVRWSMLVLGQSQSEAESFPKKAVDFLASKGNSGRLFAYYDWGGYAIWRLYPEDRVFVDGRADLYGDELLDEFKVTMQLKPRWRQVLEEWQVQTVLVPTSSALAQALALDYDWRSEYQDDRAIVFRRVGPPRGGERTPKTPSQQGKKVQKSLAELS